MWGVRGLFLLCAFLFPSISLIKAEDEEVLLENLTPEKFQNVLNEFSVNAVYFYKKDLPHLNKFLAEFSSSAKELIPYEARCVTIDCQNFPEIRHCQDTDVENNVYIFRNGEVIIKLSLDTMFDVNSIVSNVLQIVLLREVPIAQTKQVFNRLQKSLAGKSHMVFSYQSAIGTYEHRIFMEVAHAYQWKYKFALTTEKSIVADFPGYDMSEDSAIWMIPTKDMKEKDLFVRPLKYKSKHTLFNLAKFMRAFDMEPIHDITSDGLFNPYRENGFPTVYMFYNELFEDHVSQAAGEIVSQFRGHLGVMMVHTKLEKLSDFGYQKEWKVPALAVERESSTELHHMPNTDDPIEFVSKILNLELNDIGGTSTVNPGYEEDSKNSPIDPSNLGDVEVQDDPVAQAVFAMRNTPPERTHFITLNRQNYDSITTESDFAMVLYYVTFDARSMAFLYSYASAAESLAGDDSLKFKSPLAVMDCYDWTDVCGRVNVTAFPTVVIYRKGMEALQYKGMLSEKAVVATVKMYQASAPEILKYADSAASFLAGSLPSFVSSVSNVSVLGLFPDASSKEIAIFKTAAQKLHGKVVCGIAIGEIASKIAVSLNIEAASSMVLAKRNDGFEPQLVKKTFESVDNIVRWISDSKMPLVPELTSENYAFYFNLKKPFLIRFTLEGLNDPVNRILGKMRQKSDKITTAWMSIKEDQTISKRILTHYLQKEELEESLIFVNFETALVYQYTGDLEDEKINEWVNHAMQGSIESTASLTHHDWKPRHPGYDFLQMIDDVQRESNKNKDSDDELIHPEDPDFFSESEEKEIVDAMIDPDGDVRRELHELHSSRLYHQAKHNAPNMDSVDAQYKHTEL